MMAKGFASTLRQFADLGQFVVVPALAMLGPWSLAYRLLRRLCQFPWLYRSSIEQQVHKAARLGWVQCERSWQLRRRLMTAVDHCDFFLVSTRSDAWCKKNMIVEGAWPPAGEPSVLLTFHWGAGFWALRHAAAHGMKPHVLVAAAQASGASGLGVVQRLYFRLRNKAVEKAVGRPVVEVPGNKRKVVQALHRGEQLLAVVDVPADQVLTSVPVTVAGLPARLPDGILRLAHRHGIPVYLYSCGIRWADGKRVLKIRRLTSGDVDGLVQETAAALDRLIREDPAQWHFWGESERFFQGSAQRGVPDNQRGPA